METPIEFHCRVVMFGVVGLSLLLVFVKLTGMWVPSTLFVRCFGGIKFMAKISLSTAPYFVVPSVLAFEKFASIENIIKIFTSNKEISSS